MLVVLPPHEMSLGPGTIDVVHAVKVSLLAFSLDSRSSTVNILDVDLVSDEFGLRRIDDLVRLQLVDWDKWILRLSLGFEFDAVRFAAVDVFVLQNKVLFVESDVQSTTLTAENVNIAVEVAWLVHLFGSMDFRLGT